MPDLDRHLDKAWEQKDYKELADAPVDALAGVTPKDTEALKAALGITTIKDLATNKYVLWAQAIVNLAR